MLSAGRLHARSGYKVLPEGHLCRLSGFLNSKGAPAVPSPGNQGLRLLFCPSWQPVWAHELLWRATVYDRMPVAMHRLTRRCGSAQLYQHVRPNLAGVVKPDCIKCQLRPLPVGMRAQDRAQGCALGWPALLLGGSVPATSHPADTGQGVCRHPGGHHGAPTALWHHISP